MRSSAKLLVLPALLLIACDAAENVRVQELPALERSSVEARLGLPELRGPWRFAGWELEEGDTLGLDAELPAFGALWLQTQRRDSLAGLYLTAGGGRTPVQGEVRRDSVVALVAFAAPGDGRYIVGEVRQDTLWLEATSLVEQGSWRGDARAAFVRSEAAVTPFRRVRGVVAAAPAADSAALASAIDSLPPPAAPGQAPQPGTAPGTAPTGAPTTATAPRTTAQPPTVQRPTPATQPSAQPPAVTTEPAEPVVEAAVGEPEEAEPLPEPEPEVAPAVEERESPRVLGVPVERDGGLP